MDDKDIYASKNLSKMDLNCQSRQIPFESLWCRVAFDRCDKWNFTEHSHYFFELHMALSGECAFDIDGKRCTIKEREYFLLPPGKKHTILKASPDFSKFIWGFTIEDEELSTEVAKNCTCATEQANENVLFAIRIILDNAQCNQYECCNVIKNQLYFIFITLIRSLTSRKNNTVYISKTSKKTEQIKNFISDNLESKMTISDISAQFFMSERQLTRICQKEYKMTAHELKQNLQLEKIRFMLTNTNCSLKEIAVASGFSDEYSMSKFFRKHESLPPGKYRNAIKTDIIQH